LSDRIVIRKGVGHGRPTKDNGQLVEERWKVLSAAEKLAIVRKLAAEGKTEGEINAETGAGGGAVRVLCSRNGIKLTSSREAKLALIEAEGPTNRPAGVWSDMSDEERRRRIIDKARKGARETLRQQFGGR
jgi:predicted Fe-S protein YdhL (DUF1289 family)